MDNRLCLVTDIRIVFLLVINFEVKFGMLLSQLMAMITFVFFEHICAFRFAVGYILIFYGVSFVYICGLIIDWVRYVFGVAC